MSPDLFHNLTPACGRRSFDSAEGILDVPVVPSNCPLIFLLIDLSGGLLFICSAYLALSCVVASPALDAPLAWVQQVTRWQPLGVVCGMWLLCNGW